VIVNDDQDLDGCHRVSSFQPSPTHDPDRAVLPMTALWIARASATCADEHPRPPHLTSVVRVPGSEHEALICHVHDENNDVPTAEADNFARKGTVELGLPLR
jgi:hypothetical protein